MENGMHKFQIRKGTSIISQSTKYRVNTILKHRTFGKIVKCIKVENGEIYAMKCIRRNHTCVHKQEIKILSSLQSLDGDENNIVRFVESFEYEDWTCLAFEQLDMTLLDLMLKRQWKPLDIASIRMIARQLLVSLNALKNIGVTHTNIKPENIMLANHNHEPFKVKLVGFGAAAQTSRLSEARIPDACGFSAPEVLLDLPKNESIDMWGLGCTLAFLLLGSPLFPTHCEYDYMRVILKLCGWPDKSSLEDGWRSHQFFNLKDFWTFKTPEEYTEETGRLTGTTDKTWDDITSMYGLLNKAPEVYDSSKFTELREFVDLLKKMLSLNADERILPADALNHRFFKMEPHVDAKKSPWQEQTTTCKLPNPVNVLAEKTNDPILELKNSKNIQETTPFILEKGVAICCRSDVYYVDEVLKSRSFGEVARCRKEGTDEIVAIQTIRDGDGHPGSKQENAINHLDKLDPDKNNLIRFLDRFYYKDCFCLVFNVLDLSLFDLIRKEKGTRLRVAELRAIAQQMLVALRALKSIGVTNTNIRPDTITLIDHESQPFKVKLQDFGHSCETSDLPVCKIVQAIAYKAPEVHLGISQDEGVDMWGLGCTLAFLFLGRHLFPMHSEYESLRVILKLIGQPDHSLFVEGVDFPRFFERILTKDQSGAKYSWRFKTPEEYRKKTGYKARKSHSEYDKLESLDDLLEMAGEINDPTELQDLKAFVDLLKRMLTLDPAERILPAEALNHTFITMDHLAAAKKGPYVTMAQNIMAGCGLIKPEPVKAEKTEPKELKQVQETTAFRLEKGVSIHSQSAVYDVEEVLGSGCFGEVARCRKRETGEIVAVKVLKKRDDSVHTRETGALKHLSKLDPDDNNLIRFFECFTYQGCFCLVFEILDLSIFDFMKNREGIPLRVADIRAITQQMLVGLRALKSIGIAHTDIKSDNIMLVDHTLQPLRVKLIDFGLACKTSELSVTKVIQPTSYRAPEVHLGMARDESVDIWSLGCLLAFLFLGRRLFPSQSEYEALRVILKLLGQPDKSSLDNGCRVPAFFTHDKNSERPWRFNTPQEYEQKTGRDAKKSRSVYDKLESLDDLLKMSHEVEDPCEAKDIEAFVDLLKRMLTLNPADRILPADALNHRFLTMEHLADAKNSPYVTMAHNIMAGCGIKDPNHVPPDSADANWEKNPKQRSHPNLKQEELVKISKEEHRASLVKKYNMEKYPRVKFPTLMHAAV